MAVTRVASGSPRLPDPTGCFLDLSFRRLLESCIEHLQALDVAAASASGSGSGLGSVGDIAVAGVCEGSNSILAAASTSADSDTAARVLKMRHYVDTLREMLEDLRAQQDALGLDAATLDSYDTHVKAVAAAVPKVQLPPYCQNLITGTAVAPGVSPSATSTGNNGRPAPNLSYFTPPASRPGFTPAGAGDSRGGASSRGADTAGLSSAASERLREAETAQALLTDELADLTAALKANAVGMAGAVSERGRLLDATDSALTGSLAAAKLNTADAKRQVKRSGGNLCFTCMILLLVGLAFTAMIVYIKFTHLLGYRALLSSVARSAKGAGWLGSFVSGGGGGGDDSSGAAGDAILGQGSSESPGGSADSWQWRGEL